MIAKNKELYKNYSNLFVTPFPKLVYCFSLI